MLAGRFPRRCLSRFAASRVDRPRRANVAACEPSRQSFPRRACRAVRAARPRQQPYYFMGIKSDSDPSLYYLRVTICGGG